MQQIIISKFTVSDSLNLFITFLLSTFCVYLKSCTQENGVVLSCALSMQYACFCLVKFKRYFSIKIIIEHVLNI